MSQSKDTGVDDGRYTLAWIAGALVALAIGAYVTYHLTRPASDEWRTAWGTFGDYLGGTTASLLNLLALIAVLRTIRIQLVELRESREETRLSRKALEAQEDSLRVQLFENSFYSQVRLLNEIIASIDLTTGGGLTGTDVSTITGRDAFRAMCSELKRHYQRRDSPDAMEQMRSAYAELYNRHRGDLGHYFRVSYNLFRFIRDHCPASVDEKLYARIARAQLSDDELLLLFYNGLTQPKYKELIEQFAIFDNLPKQKLLEAHHEYAYTPAAYGAST